MWQGANPTSKPLGFAPQPLLANVHTRTLTPRQRERRDRILDATRDVVSAHGYDGMVMRKVAELAGVSPTTLYNLYNTKDQLVLAALRERVAESMKRTTEEFAEPGYQLLLTHLHHVAEQTVEEPVYVGAITHALLRARAGHPLTTLLIDSLREICTDALEVMSSNNHIQPDTDIAAIATAYASAFWSSFMLWQWELIDLKGLERTLLRNCVAVLLPACRGKAKRELEKLYREL